jgi:hypothetical protein
LIKLFVELVELGEDDASNHRGLTNEANRPRLRRDDERSRGSEKVRESKWQCRRGPS